MKPYKATYNGAYWTVYETSTGHFCGTGFTLEQAIRFACQFVRKRLAILAAH